MNDNCCERACRCCAVPKTTIALSVLTASFFVLATIVAFAGATKRDDCECSGHKCCVLNTDRCGSDSCFCRSDAILETYVEGGRCEERDEVLRVVPLIFYLLFSTGFVISLVVTFASCCCFGCCARDLPFGGGTIIGVPAIGMVAPSSDIEKL